MWWLTALCSAMISTAGLILEMQAYSTLDDLLSDDVNSIEACVTLNLIAKYDLATQIGLILANLFSPFFLVLNLAKLLFDAYQYKTRGPLFGWDLYDPTKILRRDENKRIHNIVYGKMAFYIFSMAAYCVVCLIQLINGYYGN